MAVTYRSLTRHRMKSNRCPITSNALIEGPGSAAAHTQEALLVVMYRSLPLPTGMKSNRSRDRKGADGHS